MSLLPFRRRPGCFWLIIILIVLLLPSEYLVNRWDARHGPHPRPAPVPRQAPDGFPDQFTGKVADVYDGDTITVHYGKYDSESKVRLEGIDAPELEQAHGGAARETLSSMVLGREVKLLVTDNDRHGRTLATVIVDGGTHVNLAMVRAGMAWHAQSGAKDAALAQAEQEARTEKRGLWQDGKPVPPWEFRRKPRQG